MIFPSLSICITEYWVVVAVWNNKREIGFKSHLYFKLLQSPIWIALQVLESFYNSKETLSLKYANNICSWLSDEWQCACLGKHPKIALQDNTSANQSLYCCLSEISCKMSECSLGSKGGITGRKCLHLSEWQAIQAFLVKISLAFLQITNLNCFWYCCNLMWSSTKIMGKWAAMKLYWRVRPEALF